MVIGGLLNQSGRGIGEWFERFLCAVRSFLFSVHKYYPQNKMNKKNKKKAATQFTP